MEVPLKPDKHMFYKPTWVKETQSASAMMTRSHGICKDGRYCVRLWVPIALRVMSTAVSTCKCKDHIQAQHRKHTMWLPRKEGICHRSLRENTVTRHSFTRSCHSFKAHAPAQHVGGPSLRASQLGVCTNTQSHCYPWIFPAPHKEVHNINKTCTVHTPPLMPWPGVFMSPASMLSSSSCCPCHRLVFVSQTHFAWFLCSKRFADLFRVRNWGSMFFEGHEKLWFQVWVYLKLFVKRFLFKRMLKIAHVFQLEMWITPKSLLFSGYSLLNK